MSELTLAAEKVRPVERPFRQTHLPYLPELPEVDLLVRAGEARRTFKVDGAGCTAAVLDTGLRLTHRDFAGRVRAARNYTADNGGAQDDPTDGDGHGTNVTGIVCAGDIHTGIAPGAGVAALKVLNDKGEGDFSDILAALGWVRDNAKVHDITAVCMSLGDPSNRQSDAGLGDDAIARVIGELAERNIVCCIAAGNDYHRHNSEQGMAYPAIIARSLSVGAVYDNNEGGFKYRSGAEAHSTAPDRITPFSQRLHAEVGGEAATDIFAPGAPVTSSGILSDMGSSIQHGTSQATPVICGVVLLLQALHKKHAGALPGVDQVRDWLLKSAVVIHDGDDEHDNVEHTNLDFHRVDAMAALTACARELALDPEVAGASMVAGS